MSGRFWMSRTAHSPFIAFTSRSHGDSPPERGARCGSRASSTCAQIADERDVDLDVLVDLGGIDLDVNLLRLGRVGRERAGDAIVEAHAAGDEQIGFLNGVVDPRLAVHAHHAQDERMRCGEAAESEQRRSDGNLQPLGEGANLLRRAGLNHAVPGEDDGALGVADQLGGLQDGVGLGAQHGMGAIGSRRGGGKVEGRRLPAARPW